MDTKIINNIKNVETKKKNRSKLDLHKLRLSLKYRPEIMKIVLKMRHCIKKKNRLLSKMKLQLKILNNKDKEVECIDSCTQTDIEVITTTKHVDIQTEIPQNEINSIDKNSKNSCKKKETENETNIGWNIGKDNDEKTVSIADQVKEVAQSALQQTGMVYVESAGMYYDYKTGYYYNTELGLYYHTDTGCYYYYSDEKQTFVFHSYPDRSQEIANAALLAHEKKKARKHKKEWKTDDDIENLTKNLSQDKEEDASTQATKPKKRKTQKKKEENEKAPSISKDKVEKGDAVKIENGDAEKVENSKVTANTVADINNKDVHENEEQHNDSTVIVEPKEDLEDGECSDSDNGESEVDEDEQAAHDSTSTASDDEAVARHHPPCMRVIVKDTTLPKLKVGSLFLITKDGGSIGREGDHHCIVLRDQNVSRNHLNITYDMSKKIYVAMDLGSKNGTVLNGTRMSESQTVSKSTEVVHGSTMEIGETKLLCHIHPGIDTCGHCEPGLLMESLEKEKKIAYTRTCSVQKQHQLELARLKNKYAPQPLAIEETAYNDRAQTRRYHVGSSHHAEKTQSSDLDTNKYAPQTLAIEATVYNDRDNDHNVGSSHHAEKTQRSDLDRFITPENKGFKLLEKMGWSKGEGLGKDNQGGTEPIPLISNEGKAGLGTGAEGLPVTAPVTSKLVKATLKLASLTKMLQPPAKAFQNEEDDVD